MAVHSRVWVAGLPLTAEPMDVVLESIDRDSRASVGRVYALINAYSATLSVDSLYRGVLLDPRSALLADGAALTIGAKLLNRFPVTRVPGPDLMTAWSAHATDGRIGMYLLGGGNGVVEGLADTLRHDYPGLRISGVFTPPYGSWTESQSRTMVELIKASGAGVVWMGISAPKQEIWAHQWADELGLPIICVGAAFDFLAGEKPRAPRLMRALGLEWLFRLMSEPRRLWRRYLFGNAVFLRDLIRYRNRPPKWAIDDGTRI